MSTERARTAISALALVAVAALSSCTADGAEKGPGHGSGPAHAAPSAASGTLEQLAERAGCTPDIQTEAEELRQANCRTEHGRYVLATFSTDRGQREWLNSAKDYGGSYLVGAKWVAVAEPAVLTKLRGRLGGDVETAAPHQSGGGEGASGHHGS
ncbi:hypothetical protein [Streptomyces thermolilacinus]|uniref:Lipoprotein n=1 Tax=Streptomyces thermolilacinus SPC6 TaxID=1306406 RepID=A0A1D3DW12_9ACTN|nr:hypothetical protein [Streptomyces thermolilacinus]OEJ96521.1 hypothetical protein J116_020790 [Streptomyces thermolilacinus SPC6]